MYGACCVRYDDERTMYGTGHCGGVNLTTCDWHPQNRKCNASVGNKKCRPWDSSNAREILKHVHKRNLAGKAGLFGFELGNELAVRTRSTQDAVHERTLGPWDCNANLLLSLGCTADALSGCACVSARRYICVSIHRFRRVLEPLVAIERPRQCSQASWYEQTSASPSTFISSY